MAFPAKKSEEDQLPAANLNPLLNPVLGAHMGRWAEVYFTPPKPNAIQVQVQAEQFAYYFRYAGPDGKFGAIHPDKIDEGNQNYFGLDPANEVEARDDIVSGELVVPVNREVQLLMHAKDVGHSFYVRELRLQQDFVPGLDLSLHFTASGKVVKGSFMIL